MQRNRALLCRHKLSFLYTYFLMTSCFFCSSDVGRPSSFCRWSYIIFSTKPLVSPSRSLSLLGSGFTFFVLISGSLVTTCAHHCILLTCKSKHQFQRTKEISYIHAIISHDLINITFYPFISTHLVFFTFRRRFMWETVQIFLLF